MTVHQNEPCPYFSNMRTNFSLFVILVNQQAFMRISLILITILLGIWRKADAQNTGFSENDLLIIFLDQAEDTNNIYTVDYYDSIQNNCKLPSDKFFCHLAKSLRLNVNDIPAATQELIEAKTYFSKFKELEIYRHYLEIVEADLYEELSKYDRAILLIDQAIAGFRHDGNFIFEHMAKMTKINILVESDQYDEGFLLIEDLLKSVKRDHFENQKQYEKFEMVLWNRRSTLMTATAHLHEDSMQKAKEILEHTIALAKERNDNYVYYNATGNLSYIHYLNEEYEKMIPLALEDLAYSEQRNGLESMGGLHTVLADAYFNLGQKDSATYHFKKAENYSKHFRSRFFYNKFVEVAQKYYKESRDIETAFESLNTQYEAINSIYKSINQINYDLSKAENNLSQAEERIHMLDLKNKQNIIINWLLGLLALSIGLLAVIFYRLHHAQKKFRNELEQINHNLESEIERRTKEVVEQSEKIKAAAYHNSHRTRAPVARLLGLVDILNTEIPSEREEIAEYIRQSAREIDEVIIDMNEVLSNRSD